MATKIAEWCIKLAQDYSYREICRMFDEPQTIKLNGRNVEIYEGGELHEVDGTMSPSVIAEYRDFTIEWHPNGSKFLTTPDGDEFGIE